MKLTLLWPPSVNRYWRHVGAKVLISQEGREYVRAVRAAWTKWRVMACRSPDPISRPIRVSIVANQPDRRRRDLDNLLKAVLDALTKSGVWADDSLIHDLRIRWGEEGAKGTLEVTIEVIE